MNSDEEQMWEGWTENTVADPINCGPQPVASEKSESESVPEAVIKDLEILPSQR